MVGWVLLLIVLVMNTVVYWLIDAYFLYHEALHTTQYKSKVYTQQKNFAQKKISIQGYMNQ